MHEALRVALCTCYHISQIVHWLAGGPQRNPSDQASVTKLYVLTVVGKLELALFRKRCMRGDVKGLRLRGEGAVDCLLTLAQL